MEMDKKLPSSSTSSPQGNDNQQSSPVNQTETPKPAIGNRPGIIVIAIAVAIAIIVIGLGAYYFGTKNKQSLQTDNKANPSNLNTPAEMKKESNENLIVGKCNENSSCTLKQVSVNGTQTEYSNNYNFNKDSQVLYSHDGMYLVYISENQGVVIVNLRTDSTKNVSATKQATLVRMHEDSFWLVDDGNYKLVDFNGNVKLNLNKSLFPRHYDAVDISLDLSPVYSDNRILALSITKGEGAILRTAWEIIDGKPKKLYDLHFNKTGSPSIVNVEFFHTEPAFLVVSENETYKLSPTNQKNVLIEGGSNLGAIESPLLSTNDTELYYSLHGGSYSQSDTAGLYKFNLKTSSNQQLIKGNAYNPSDQSFHSYQVLSVSPSGKYLALTDAVVSAQVSTTYTPSIFSLNDMSIKRLSNDSGNIYEARKVFGWINKSN